MVDLNLLLILINSRWSKIPNWCAILLNESGTTSLATNMGFLISSFPPAVQKWRRDGFARERVSGEVCESVGKELSAAQSEIHPP